MPSRVQDGSNIIDVEYEEYTEVSPLAPTILPDEEGSIFVSIPSYRDAKRCADTIDALYTNAVNPETIFVGLVEQNKEADGGKTCIQYYCEKHGATVGRRKRFFDPSDGEEKCPHFHQIRLLSIFDIAAKGPAYARSLTRKILKNEEFCLQIDAHTDFTRNWDTEVKKQWLMTENEYAIISTRPAPIEEKAEHEEGGARFTEVPRRCHIGYHPEGIPWYNINMDVTAHELKKPLLTTAWNAGFSFAKCHLEVSTPYDPFTPLVFDLEEFPRFARFWTRGYDVYTPTRNIVYHEYSPPLNVDPRGFRRHEPTRRESVKRIKTLLQIKGGETTETDQANLGIYGLGSRRSLQQLESFVGINMTRRAAGRITECGSSKWVPYDLSISPLENLYEHANDLDPQPEFPLRKEKFLAPVKDAQVVDLISNLHPHIQSWEEIHAVNKASIKKSTSSYTLFFLWVFGLISWCWIYLCRSKVSRFKKDKMMRTAGIRTKVV